MKKFVIIILLLFSGINLWSQNDLLNKTIEVTYIKGYKNYKDTVNAPPRLMKNLEYQLLLNNNEARFEYISSMISDGDRITNSRFIGKGGGDGIYYKNLKQKEKLVQTDNDNQKLYLVEEDLNQYKWTLHKDQKKILGYDCFKATGQYSFFGYFRNRKITINITAWYTPSIPVPFGPSGYDGLPGLVLEAQKGSFYFIAQEVNFHNKTKPIKRPNEGELLSREEFHKTIFNNKLKRDNMTKEEWYEMVKKADKKNN